MISAKAHSENAPARGAILWPTFFLLAIWTWAIWAAAEIWQGNPNYSYGWAVPLLMFGFAVRRYLILEKVDVDLARAGKISLAVVVFVAIATALLAFALEYAREQVWHPIVVIWAIAVLAITSTIVLLWRIGGLALARAEIFAVAFFLTAVPWPPRLEQPLTSTLMRWVALATTELLHWLGIQAQAAGGAIALRNGLVGITEACSGIRSLQTSVMFGLAIGEWFLLTATRRVILLAVALALAIATNLARTLTLTLHANANGIESVDRVHDLIGNIIITALVIAIWVGGKLLARSTSSVAAVYQRRRASAAAATDQYACATLTVALVVGLIAARATTAHIEAKHNTQTAPFFHARIDGLTNRSADIPRPVWNELHPTSGEYIRHDPTSAKATAGGAVDLSAGRADCFHFFWKPSPWNRFALVHRPDICMPGIGWQLNGAVEQRDIEIDGHALRLYAFRFHRGKVHALELWGAWRNGEPVPIDYQPDQVLGATAAPGAMHLEGKRRSATEIVSCSIMSEDRQPDAEKAVEILRAVFGFNPQ